MQRFIEVESTDKLTESLKACYNYKVKKLSDWNELNFAVHIYIEK